MDEQTAKRQQNEKIGHVVSGLNETEERMAMKVHMISTPTRLQCSSE
jgi:hypothetical protein